jgi:hypothetical protein
MKVIFRILLLSPYFNLFILSVVLGQSRFYNNPNNLICNNNTFWALKNNSGNLNELYEFNFQNDSIFFVSLISNNCPGLALIYSSNVNLGNPNPTFYTNNSNLIPQDSPYFLDSLNWSATNIFDTLQILNGGGNNSNIFYTGRNGFYTKYIIRYNGSSLNIIYQTPFNTSISVLDLAVDANNNIWFFTSNDSTLLVADRLNVIDFNGNLVKQYFTDFVALWSYGLCIIQDTLYIGFGSYNGTFPNSLYSVKFDGDTAKLDNQFFFPGQFSTPYWADLASCNPGVPTGFKDIRKPPAEQINVYPNPSADKITIDHIPKNAQELSIINSMGAIIFLQKLNGENKLDLFTASYAPGMYAVCIKTNTEVLVRKWIKGKM